MSYYIPEELKQKDNWIVHIKKKPYSIIKHDWGGQTTREHWASFDQAALAVKYGEFDGLGFALSKEDNITCIDIDSCINENGALSDFAEEMLSVFHDTYAEISSSGKGLHIFCKGIIKETIKEPVEIYSQNQFIAITGNVWTEAGLTDKQKELDALYTKYNKKTKAAKKPQKIFDDAFCNSVEEVIANIEKSPHGSIFRLLHYGGWEEAIPYKKADGEPDTSRADFLYFLIVIKFAGANSELAKQVFYKSKLAEREKAHREKYVDLTVSRAIAKSKEEVYKSPEELFEARRKRIIEKPVKRRRF